MKTLLLSTFVGLAMLMPAEGRIGETPAQCEARYGKPLKIDKDAKIIFYQKGGLNLAVIFFEGKADGLIYSKIETDVLNHPVEMSATEIEVILKANANGKEWKKDPMSIIDKMWRIEEELFAQYSIREKRLTVITGAYAKRAKEETEAKEKANLDGF